LQSMDSFVIYSLSSLSAERKNNFARGRYNIRKDIVDVCLDQSARLLITALVFRVSQSFNAVVKEQLIAKLQETEEWLYEDGEDETKGVYVTKLDELKKVPDSDSSNKATQTMYFKIPKLCTLSSFFKRFTDGFLRCRLGNKLLIKDIKAGRRL
ncbi:heat shock 70 kDa protein 15-like protein, partial [Tanacetum coccineum]